MSSDLQLAHACPHLIRFERITVTDDNIIIGKCPISGLGLISLYLNDMLIPPKGLFTEAKVIFPQTNQYRFPLNFNSLSISSTSFPTLNISFPTNPFNQKELTSYLNSKLPTELTAIADSNSVAITDRGLGVSFTLKGTAMVRLGFDTSKRVVRAKQLVPSWNLIKRDEVAGTRYNLKFNGEVPSHLKQGVMDYQTSKVYCRRCDATGVENDVRFGETGDILKVYDHDLLYQRVAKVCLTEIGTNPFHAWYGSNAQKLIGKKSTTNVTMLLRESVYRALENIKEAQRLQSQAQLLTLEERLADILSVEANYIGNDVTSVLVSVVVRSASNKRVNINIVFAVPGSIPLDGDLA